MARQQQGRKSTPLIRKIGLRIYPKYSLVGTRGHKSAVLSSLVSAVFVFLGVTVFSMEIIGFPLALIVAAGLAQMESAMWNAWRAACRVR